SLPLSRTAEKLREDNMLFESRTAAAVAALAAGVLLQTAACNAAEKEVRIALSFPNGVVWPYFSVATEMGYAKEEGIAFKLTSKAPRLAFRRLPADRMRICAPPSRRPGLIPRRMYRSPRSAAAAPQQLP